MNEHLQDKAVAYALDALPEPERVEFEHALARDPELQAVVRDFRDALGELAQTLPKRDPSPATKARVLERIAGSPRRTAIALPSSKTTSNVTRLPIWFPWAAAALLAAGCFWLWGERSKLGTEVAAANEQQGVVEGMISSLRAEAATLRVEAQSAVADVARLEREAGALEQTVTRMQAEVAQARETADLARLQIARLSSLVSDQQATGVSLWNESTQQGVLLVENLPLPPAGKTYEVWVIDPGTETPISAGLFSTDNEGRGRLVFRPRANVRSASQFAISVEAPGGSQKAGPTGPVIMAGEAKSL